MSQAVLVESQMDFSGGLNLRADGFDLARNESPDLLNVDVDGRGGFSLRGGVDVLNATALSAAPKSVWSFETTAGTKQVLCSYGTALAYSTGGDFTAVAAITQTTGLRHSAATFQNLCYIQNGTDGAVKWDGTTATRLGTTFNDNLAAPTGGNMPKAKYIAAHLGRMWVAYTSESGTAYPNRVRFSHPTNTTGDKGPEDWRTNDYIDIDVGADGDVIQALVPFGDRMYVFKRDAIYAIVGYDPQSFQVFPVSQNLGASGPDALVACEEGVFFFHWPTGVHALAQNGSTKYLWERLHPAITEGHITDSAAGQIALGYHKRRVWVSLPWEGSAFNDRAFVCDLTIKGTPWVAYDTPIGAYHEWRPSGGTAKLLGIDASTATSRGLRIVTLQQAATTDDYGLGATHIESYYSTRWFHAGAPSQKKRYRKPDLIVVDNDVSTLTVQVFKDFDNFSAVSSFPIVTSVPGGALVWGTGKWGVDSWGGASAHRDSTKQGATLGAARAIRFRIDGPTNENVNWGVHTISLKYIPRRIR